jgi:hypothetical protein
LAVLAWASSRHRFVRLKREKICVSDSVVVQKSREKNWPAWGRRFVAWMAAGFEEKIVTLWVGWRLRCSLPETRAPMSASKAVAVMPTDCLGGRWRLQRRWPVDRRLLGSRSRGAPTGMRALSWEFEGRRYRRRAAFLMRRRRRRRRRRRPMGSMPISWWGVEHAEGTTAVTDRCVLGFAEIV